MYIVSSLSSQKHAIQNLHYQLQLVLCLLREETVLRETLDRLDANIIICLLTKLLLELVYIDLINKAKPKHLLPSPRDCGLDSHELRYC